MNQEHRGKRMFSKILIADRGETAVRIIQACQELGVITVAVHSELDRGAPHVRLADEVHPLGPAHAPEGRVDAERILDVIAGTAADAVHPGRGFLATSAAFARALEKRGVAFIGPSASTLESLRAPGRTRELAAAAGAPVVPGTSEPVSTLSAARRLIESGIGYPVMVKPARGSSGRGFRVALTEAGLEAAFEGSASEGEELFGDGSVCLERYLPNARNIEVQVLADGRGNAIHLGERDCTVRRRHQRLIGEAPAPGVTPELRASIGRVAVGAAVALGCSGACTVDGLLQDGKFYVRRIVTGTLPEQCVTETVTGIDIVKEAIRIAAGAPLLIGQDDVVVRGHSIVCCINAADASQAFAPAGGRIASCREPTGPGVRVDSGVEPGCEISPIHDPMIAKLTVWDADREQATSRMIRALREYRIAGVRTLLPFHEAILQTRQWANAESCRDLMCDRQWLETLAFSDAQDGAQAVDAPEPGEEITALLEQSRSVYRELTALGLREAGLGGIASAIAHAAGFGLVVEQEIVPPFRQRFGPLPSEVNGERVVLPIMAGDQALGHIVAMVPELTELQSITLDLGITMIAFDLLKHRAARDVEWRLRGELLEELLHATGTCPPALLERARRLGVDLTAPLRVYAFEARGGSMNYGDLLGTVRTRAASRLQTRGTAVLTVKREDKVILALPEVPAKVEDAIIDDVCVSASSSQATLLIGVSGLMLDLSAANGEAVACLRLARRAAGGHRVVRSSDLGPMRFLLGSPNFGHVDEMIRERLGALIDRDARSGSDLLPTLRAYLDADGHQPTTAAARHIHVSTLKYRLKQIRDLIGGDIADPEYAFELRLAIKLMDLVDAVVVDEPMPADRVQRIRLA